MLTKEKNSEYISIICNEVYKAQENSIGHTTIYEGKSNAEHQNEFVLFMKPNVTIKADGIKLREITKLIFSKINEFGLSVNLIKVLPGSYLAEYNIMAQHYGVINKLSVNVRDAMSEAGKIKFEKLYGISFDEADIYGGHEFLDKFPKFTPFAASVLWQSTGFQKLTSGTYAGKFTFDGHDYYMVNGFHPRQLNHFNLEGRSIVVFALSGELDWAKARNEFIGVTDPSKALAGSIRHELFYRKDEFGIPIMNTAYNGVHLSAGPVEAVNELIRFSSDFRSDDKIKRAEDFIPGRVLKENFSDELVKKILDNEKVEKEGHSFNAFDLTEEKNTSEMVEILKKYY